MRSRLCAVPGLVLLVASSCRPVGPSFRPPQAPIADVWHQEVSEQLRKENPDLQAWWTTLNDPVLEDLIRRARENSLTVQQAVSVIRESRLRRSVVQRNLQPVVDISATYTRAKSSGQDPLFSKLPQASPTPFNLYSAGFDVAWEADVFGRVRRSVEAADAGVEASIETYHDVLVTLFAEVARNYIDLRTFQQRIAYADRNIAIQTESLRLARARFGSGVTGRLDVEQAQSNLSNTESVLPSLLLGREVVLNQVALLISDQPGALPPALAESAPIPSTPAEVVVGLPANLLRQRPDIRRAERLLAIEAARTGILTADLYPRFGLVGDLGLTTTDVTKLSGAGTFGVTPFFRWNIFNRGRLRDAIHAQEEVTQQALLGYENTVLLAQMETESAIVGYREERRRFEALQEAVGATERATGLVRTLYDTGLTDFQNVLDTERTLFLQQDQLAISEGQVTKNLISLYKALGGGWATGSHSTVPAPVQTEQPFEE